MSIRYAFYGDDFTGSTDVLEQLSSSGISTVLFSGIPTPAQLAMFPDAEAIGIAGDSRSRSPEWMSEHLPQIFRYLARFKPRVIHYKVCSTFDSSTTQGSIGTAIELGIETLQPRFVPIVVGAPHLRRYVAFGNLFAAAPDGQILRIDRHPMAHHSVTPMLEADLRRHLGRQTSTSSGLVDLTSLASVQAAQASLESQIGAGNKAVVFDTIDMPTQEVVGDLLWRESLRCPIFSASSSGLTSALTIAWRRAERVTLPNPLPRVSPIRPLLVVSGSCSRATEQQIRWALDHGFHGLYVDPAILSSAPAVEAVAASLNACQDTILYTSLGPSTGPAAGENLGAALGSILREVLARTAVRRVLVCGGDTSSHAVQQLGLYALTWIANLQAGAPLCRAHSASAVELELVLKGGQIGTEDFFQVVREGR
jgi:uncharacterized protein YgbK (DUF1537 family)